MSSKMESKKDGQSFDKSLLDVGGGLSEERKMTLLRRFNAQTEELDIEEDDDEDFWANIDLNRMSRLDIKIALQARGLSTRGNKTKIRLRLEQSIEEEKQDELEFLANLRILSSINLIFNMVFIYTKLAKILNLYKSSISIKILSLFLRI